jgi:hypothetical protein
MSSIEAREAGAGRRLAAAPGGGAGLAALDLYELHLLQDVLEAHGGEA